MTETSDESFGDRLRVARERHDVTSAAVSKVLGVSAKAYSRWEDGHARPRVNRLPIIAGTLNVSMRWLMTGEDDLSVSLEDSQAPRERSHALLEEVRSIKENTEKTAEKLVEIEARLRKMARRYAAGDHDLENFL